MADFWAPPKTIVGGIDEESVDTAARLYEGLPGPMLRTSPELAELAKYTDNAWHALKVAFANEMGNVAQANGIDSHELMELFCQDTKLNISRAYLRPGFAFGGSCLPKDVRALVQHARGADLSVPVLSSILPSNAGQVDRAMARITALGKRRIGVLGISFKAGTDDLRESPVVELVERLIVKGYRLKLFDHNVRLSMLTGSNKAYMLEVIPHLGDLLV